MGMATDMGLALAESVAPLDRPHMGAEGSTDVGDVSWAVPTVQARVATCAVGTPFHTWQLTAQGKAPAALKGMEHAAKIMATTARTLFERADLLAAAQAEHAKRMAATPYVCPMPNDVMPPVRPRV